MGAFAKTKDKMKPNRLVGIRPTGKLHLGHYFSVIKPAIEFDCDVLIAKYHAPYEYVEYLESLKQELIRYGVKEEQIIEQEIRSPMFFQMLTLATSGVLGDMTQYKSAKEKNAHLFIYPVLMAHDVTGYDEVYVGEDQKQHLEFANKILRKWGCPEVKPVISGGRIMSLSNPSKKMSKSEPKGCLFLSDSPEEIKSKVKKAVTDEAGMKNLKVLWDEFCGGKMPKSNKEMKEKLAEKLIHKFHETLHRS